MLPSYPTVSAGGPPGPPNTPLHGGNSHSHHFGASNAPYPVPSLSYGTSMARKYPHSKLRHPEHKETLRRHNASSGCAATSQRVVDARFSNNDHLGSRTPPSSTYKPKRQSSTTVLDQSHSKIKYHITTLAKEEQALWAHQPVAREARKQQLRKEAKLASDRVFCSIGEENPDPENFKKVYMSLLESLTVDYHERKAASCPSTPNPSPAHEPISTPEKLSKPSSREGKSTPSQARGIPTKGFVEHAELIQKDEPLQLRRNDTSCSDQPENPYDISGTNLESEHQVGVPPLEYLQMSSKPFEKLSPVSTDDIHWETCPTKETSPLVAHQSVDEPRDLTLENVASSVSQIVDGRSSSSAAGTTHSNPCPESQYLLPGIDHDGK